MWRNSTSQNFGCRRPRPSAAEPDSAGGRLAAAGPANRRDHPHDRGCPQGPVRALPLLPAPASLVSVAGQQAGAGGSGNGRGGGLVNRVELGRVGEQLAADHLEEQGLVVVARNWRCQNGEIDIIATDGIGTLVVCEVKTRRGIGYGTPAEAVTQDKRRRLRQLAGLYITSTCRRWPIVRFDVISVLYRPGSADQPEITHLIEAF